jgi:hypothetical protein
MPARPDFEPILPKGPITHTNIARVHAALRDFAAKAHNRLAAYPPRLQAPQPPIGAPAGLARAGLHAAPR